MIDSARVTGHAMVFPREVHKSHDPALTIVGDNGFPKAASRSSLVGSLVLMRPRLVCLWIHVCFSTPMCDRVVGMACFDHPDPCDLAHSSRAWDDELRLC